MFFTGPGGRFRLLARPLSNQQGVLRNTLLTSGLRFGVLDGILDDWPGDETLDGHAIGDK